MLVLSKLTNINHANGGSYDPPLFLYSALFAARGRFGGASPHGGGVWRGFPARRRALAGCSARRRFGGASPHGGELWRGFPARRRAFAGLPRTAAALAGFPARRRALAGLPRTAAGFGGLPRTAALWRGFPARRWALAGRPARRRALAGLPRPAAGFSGASPHGFLCRRGTFGFGAGGFFAVFRIRARHTAKASAKISPVILPYFILRRKIQEVC